IRAGDADGGPGGVHGVVLGAVRAVQIGGGLERIGAGLGVVLVAVGVGRERLVPDLAGLVVADAGDGRAVARRAVAVPVIAAADGREEEPVAQWAERVVRVQRAVAAGVAVRRIAVERGLVHVAQRLVVAVDVDQLADRVVGRVLGVVRVELHHGAEDVAGALVHAAGLTGLIPAGESAADAVAHLVAGDVDLDERTGAARAVAV